MDTEKLLESLTLGSIKERLIFWDHESCTGHVSEPKGCIWNTIGILSSGNATLLPEEALFLAEFKNFEICDKECKSLSAYNLLKISKQPRLHKIYNLYKFFKKHGFILMRPECKYFPRSRILNDFRAEFSLFKPSSSFKKKEPSGYLGRVVEIKEDDIMKIAEEAEEECTLFLALNDGMNDFCILETNLIDPLPCPNGSNHFETS